MAKTFERVTTSASFIEGVEDSRQTSITTYVRRTTSEPPFVKFYVEDIGKLKKLQGKTVQILLEFLRVMNYRNEVNVSIGTKEEICETFGIYNQTKVGKVLGINIVDQHIYKLIKAGVLARKRKGVFIIDPVLFGKGEWANVKQVFLTLEYKDEGRIMYAKIKK